MRPSAITRRTPWKSRDVCPCDDCRKYHRTAQDSNIEKRLYAHMNSQRSADDKRMEQSGDYVVGHHLDIRRMFEAILALRTPNGNPLPGCGLSIIHRCCLCAAEQVVTVPTLEVDDALGKPLPGAPHGSTQAILDQQIGAEGMLHHLPANPYEHLGAVKMFGAQCPDCRINGKRVDTMLPWALDDTQPLPPILRFNKSIGSNRITSIPDTVSVKRPGGQDPIVYELLAIVYGSGSHFTCDIRSSIDEGSRAFTHYDAFHLRNDRVLLLDNDQPACNGGRPQFLPRHTEHIRAKFHEFTNISHVASAVYGRITSHEDDAPVPVFSAALASRSIPAATEPIPSSPTAMTFAQTVALAAMTATSTTVRHNTNLTDHVPVLAEIPSTSNPSPLSSIKKKQRRPCLTACTCCSTCPHCQKRFTTTLRSRLRRHFKTCKKRGAE
jgi:hypothetical protein